MNERWIGAAALGLLALLGLLFGLFAVPGLPAWHGSGAPASGVRLLDRAQFAMSDAASPPAHGWQEVSLPDSWRQRRPQASGLAWYRLPFDLGDLPREPLALYLPRLAPAGEIWLNGSLLAPGTQFDPGAGPSASMADEPVYLVLPSGLFRLGTNVIDVRLQGDSQIRSGLSAIRLGAIETLQPMQAWRRLLQTTIPKGLLVLTAGALCFVYAYLLRQRRFQPIQVALVAAVALQLLYLLLDLPLSLGREQAVRTLAGILMYWLLCLAGLRMSGVRHAGPRIAAHAAAGLGAAAVLGLAAADRATDQVWLLAWPIIALDGAVAALLLWHAWRQRSVKQALLALGALLWVATICQSLALLMEWPGLPWDSFRWSQAGALPFCVMLLFFFAERFILDREEAAAERQAAIQAERNRILQDMHDGMGAQLITAQRMARRPDVDREDLARAIEEALQDLRLIIDSLDLIAQRDLLPLLGNLRFRLQSRLAALGIELQWQVQPTPELSGLKPEASLAILRVVQEAINNALRHASATRIRIAIRAADGGTAIEVSDDGQGFDHAREATGAASSSSRRGLQGMQLRAGRIGAQLRIASTPGQGTTLTLLLPADKPGPAARR